MRLGDLATGRDNHLNLIRMVAAYGVLVSHAYPIALGPGTAEPLKALTGVTLGTLCVYVFFAISGFLICQSYDRSSGIDRWAAARIQRIVPGLLVVTLLTAFVLGPAVTALPLGTYLTHPDTLTYVPRNVLLAFLQFPLPGVFEGNPYGPPINGSLWTLFYEVVCYGGVLLAGLLGLLRRPAAFGIALAAVAAGYAAVLWGGVGAGTRLVRLADLGLPFAIGMALYVWRDRVRLRPWLALALVLGAALANGTPAERPALVLALSYGVFVLGYRPKGPALAYNRLGDYSYGTYVYAFPVQQAAMHVAPGLDPLGNILVSTPPTILLAVLSWRFVEKPALALKARWRPSRAAGRRTA